MNPTQFSAQFAAYVWYLNQRNDRPEGEEEAVRFAQENWAAFRRCAHEGLGRLLARIAGVERTQSSPKDCYLPGSRRLALAGMDVD
jgi:hypothetical protein